MRLRTILAVLALGCMVAASPARAQGTHMHFIDGADGGLFLAAKDYKRRLALIQARWN